MNKLIKELLAYVKTTSYKRLYEKYHESLFVTMCEMEIMKKSNPSYKTNLKKISYEITGMASEISYEIGSHYYNIYNEESPISLKIDKAYIQFEKSFRFQNISKQEEEIEFLIKTILKLIGMMDMEDKTKILKKTSKTPNLIKIKTYLEKFDKFVEENGRKPNRFSTDPIERKLYMNVYSKYRKIDTLPECMQEKLREIFPKTDVIGKCEEYIKFVKEHKKIPSKITDDPYEKWLASFRSRQVVNLNRRKKPLPEDEFDKLKIVINHYDLLAKVITLK